MTDESRGIVSEESVYKLPGKEQVDGESKLSYATLQPFMYILGIHLRYGQRTRVWASRQAKYLRLVEAAHHWVSRDAQESLERVDASCGPRNRLPSFRAGNDHHPPIIMMGAPFLSSHSYKPLSRDIPVAASRRSNHL